MENQLFCLSSCRKKSLAIHGIFAYTLKVRWGKVVICAMKGMNNPIPALKR